MKYLRLSWAGEWNTFKITSVTTGKRPLEDLVVNKRTELEWILKITM
jgi:hypothetical protein